MTPDGDPDSTPVPEQRLTGVRRFLAAGSFAFLVGAGLLLYSVYKDSDAGLSLTNLVRCLAAGGLVALAVIGTRLRHGAGR